MPSYTCGRCTGGPTGMTGHYGTVCHVTARVENRQGLDALLDNPFHFCCPDDCELFNEDGSAKPPVEVEPEPDGDFLAPDWLAGLHRKVGIHPHERKHCDVVREGDETPCPLPAADEVHVDESGDVYRMIPLTDGQVHGG